MFMCFQGGSGTAGGPSSASFGAGEQTSPTPPPMPPVATASTAPQQTSVQRVDAKSLDDDQRDPNTGLPLKNIPKILEPRTTRRRDQSLMEG